VSVVGIGRECGSRKVYTFSDFDEGELFVSKIFSLENRTSADRLQKIG
jgi:hypothetical protein